MSKPNWLLIGGVGVGAYLLLSKTGLVSSSTVLSSSPSSPTIPGAPAPPAAFSKAYYLAYQRPAMLAANPNVGNPNYTLTPAEASQYLNNYLDLQQFFQNNAPGFNGVSKSDVLGSLQYHWKVFGVPEQRTFLPLMPQSNVPYVYPPVPAKPTSSGGLFASLLKVATVVGGGVLTIASGGALAPIVAPATSAALAAEGLIHGVDSDLLSPAEVEIVVAGSAIAKNILPFYLNYDKQSVTLIENSINSILQQYI